MEDHYKVIIIGSGPAGYTAAIYLGRAGYKPLILAGELSPGGQLMDTTTVENYPGFPNGVMGPDLMDYMHQQAEAFSAVIEYVDVDELRLSSDGSEDGHPVKIVKASNGKTYLADAVIVTTGSKRRRLNIPGEDKFAGNGVSYCATCDGFFFKHQPIIVIGGGDTAFEDALYLSKLSDRVSIVYRRSQPTAEKILVDRVRENKHIKERHGLRPVAIVDSKHAALRDEEGNDHPLLGLAVASSDGDDHAGAVSAPAIIPTAAIFIDIGSVPSTDFLKDSLDLRDDGTIVTIDGSTRTSMDGVFAAGDVVDSKYRQAIVAAGDGCKAALDAQEWLNDLGAGAAQI
jgi:thioredoxin reductase (NADPH)